MATKECRGALVVDTERNKFGYVMGHEGPYVQLRPVTGGREWDADPACVRRGTEHGSGLGVHRWVVEQSFALLH